VTSSWRLGFDIGGTFTDFVLQEVNAGAVFVGKELTTPRDPSEGVVRGLAALLATARVRLADVDQIVHGTTLGANLVIERRGARTFLVTTRGFRDVLEIQRQFRYNLNDFFLDKHPPLIPRDQIVEVTERVQADGRVHVPLDEAEARDLARALLGEDASAEQAEAIARESGGNPLFIQELVQYLHSNCGLRIADCGFQDNPQSAIRNPQSDRPPHCHVA